MKDAQKPDHVSLNTLINRIKEGRYVIPDFQREFEWGPADIRELMRSIFLDYYIGSLLLWKGKPENFDALSCENIYGYKGDARPEHIVLDGQQRLTAMHYAFLAPDVPLPSRANRYFYFLRVDKFMAEEHDEAFDYDWRVRRWPAMLTNLPRQYAEHIFPFAVVGTGGWELGNWVQGYEQFWRDKAIKAENEEDDEEFERASQRADNAKEFGDHLKGITEQYQVSYVELDRELEVDKVCDIFTQVNSRGVRLDVFDLMNALLKPKGLQLKKMWRNASKKLEFVDSEKMNVYILQVMSILRQAYCSPKYLYFLLPGTEKPRRDPDGTRRKEVLVPDIPAFEARWDSAVNALEGAIKLLRHPQEFGAISSNYLPYISILPVFAALQAQAKSVPPNRQLDAQRKIRHWYWSSVFTNRYSGSVDSTSSRDFLDVTAWLDNDDAEPSLLQDFQQRFRSIEFRKEIKRGTSVYNGIFNLLVVQGARDWMTGNVPQYGDLDDHHIVPASWGLKNLKGTLVHTILNRTPLTSATNRKVIRDRLPNEYLPELIAANGEKTVRAILESHFISPAAQGILLRDPFGPEDFDAFITERQRTLQDAIENLLIKERIDLSPQLRELDEKIEAAERNLRNEIARTLEASSNEIPSHVAQKIGERIQRAAKKNAAFDIDYYNELEGKLEFADLRELQEIIVSKSVWPQFEAAFLNKDTLTAKFNQLAELRNGIRHSRTVDEITRKEGEAALLWFNQVLKGTAVS
jgi:hypothetical protein